MVKILMKYMAEDIGPEHASKEYLYRLFPKGPSRQGSRIAGLPEPQGCLDPDA
jgi:tRNA 2-thiouridine synthesizing protein E